MMASDRSDLRRPIGLTMSQACPEITKPRLLRNDDSFKLRVAGVGFAVVALVALVGKIAL